MTHTPGPWRVDETKATGAYGVWTDYATHPGWDGAGYESQICSVVIVGRDEDIPREQRDANARLIAAAPELLEACQLAIGSLIKSDDDVSKEVFRRISAAISKAEGRA